MTRSHEGVKRVVGALVAFLMVGGLAACSPSQPDAQRPSEPEVTEPPLPTETVSFSSDVEASAGLLKSAEVAVIASETPLAQMRAAALGSALAVPVLTQLGGASVESELSRLGVQTVLAVGDVTLPGGVQVMVDDGTTQAATTILGREVQPVAELGVADILGFDRAMPLVPEFLQEEPAEDSEGAPAEGELAEGQPGEGDPAEGENPAGEAETGEAEQVVEPELIDLAQLPVGKVNSPNPNAVAFATAGSPLGLVANAKTAGLPVVTLPVADLRATSEGMQMARDGRVAVGLGSAFGTPGEFRDLVALADAEELPGGGGLVFPDRRMIALYGHPYGGALGVLGEQDPTSAAELAVQYAAEYQEFSAEPVLPAFEIIATVASAGPGDDGLYSDVTPVEDLVASVDAITEVGGYAIIDLQPGRASLLDQAKIYEELLKRPNVGLALDPEWKLYGDEVHLEQVGHIEVAEANEVSQWLAGLVRANNLPQKVFMLHQFQWQMIRDREQLVTRPELATIIHVDGHGTPGAKYETWNVIRDELPAGVWLAWKNFIDEDEPMLNPQQTMEVEPSPWIVSFQ
ncbi:MAG: hypothetical protein Q4E01_00485 [Actinomycetaceae bacterium]|nr:hypothetical protein [Actinomycetaceae bacterium]